MVRIYRVVQYKEGVYSNMGYYLDLSQASRFVLNQVNHLRKGSRVIVQQLDVYPCEHVLQEVLTLDGLNA